MMNRLQKISSILPLFAAMSLLPILGCKKESATATTEQGIPTVHVESAAIETALIPQVLVLTGSLRGERETNLAANANGRVMKTLVERGEDVKAGAVIAQLDVRTLALNAQEARVNADLAKQQATVAQRECARYEALSKTGAISSLEYDKLRDQCSTAGLSVQAANTRADVASQAVGDGIIRAPFAGTITERSVEVGQYVRQDTAIASLVTLDSLRLVFTVPETQIALVKEGATVEFRVASYPDQLFSGVVKFIGASIRSTTRDLVVEAIVENKKRTLRPGMFATLELRTGEETLPVVPKDAITAKNGRSFVFIVNGGRAEERVVQLGATLDQRVSIANGVTAGEKVVIKTPQPLRNGQPVN